jgi:hypothetical protein
VDLEREWFEIQAEDLVLADFIIYNEDATFTHGGLFLLDGRKAGREMAGVICAIAVPLM